mgnify:CR=1 FL=1
MELLQIVVVGGDVHLATTMPITFYVTCEALGYGTIFLASLGSRREETEGLVPVKIRRKSVGAAETARTLGRIA